ncbi:MAG: hypothetical protein DDT34_01113 [Firmicutes bacterium]|nr:hypothetical protein [Bacillota bacterium]
MRDLLADPKRIRVAVFGFLFAVAAFFGGGAVSERWTFAWDNGDLKCLPYVTFLIDKQDLEVVRGDLVSFRTFGISASVKPNSVFTKLVAGIPGDHVEINEEGVFVNDAHLGPVFEDVAVALKRDVSSFHAVYVLQDDQFFLVGTEVSSFDSRFYGPVPATQFVGQTYGVW